MGHFQRATARAHTQKCSELERDPSLGLGITHCCGLGGTLEIFSAMNRDRSICKSGVYTQSTQPVLGGGQETPEGQGEPLPAPAGISARG